MRKIYLFCSAGMSTSLVVTRMQKAAENTGYETEIAAYPVGDVDDHAGDADMILLGPQIRFKLNSLKQKYPEKIIEMIDMQDYGRMNGENILNFCREKLGDK